MRVHSLPLVTVTTLSCLALLSCGEEVEPYFVVRGRGVVADEDSLYYFTSDSRRPQEGDIMVLDESFAALDPHTLRRSMGCVLARANALVVIAHP
jgi:hypothetical protein